MRRRHHTAPGEALAPSSGLRQAGATLRIGLLAFALCLGSLAGCDGCGGGEPDADPGAEAPEAATPAAAEESARDARLKARDERREKYGDKPTLPGGGDGKETLAKARKGKLVTGDGADEAAEGEAAEGEAAEGEAAEGEAAEGEAAEGGEDEALPDDPVMRRRIERERRIAELKRRNEERRKERLLKLSQQAAEARGLTGTDVKAPGAGAAGPAADPGTDAAAAAEAAAAGAPAEEAGGGEADTLPTKPLAAREAVAALKKRMVDTSPEGRAKAEAAAAAEAPPKADATPKSASEARAARKARAQARNRKAVGQPAEAAPAEAAPAEAAAETRGVPASAMAPTAPPLDIERYLALEDVRKLTGDRTLVRDGGLSGIPANEFYNSAYFAPPRRSNFGVAIQVWRDPTRRGAKDRFERMLGDYPNAEETNALKVNGFFSSWNQMMILTFLDFTNRMVVSVSCSVDVCTPEELFLLTQEAKKRI